MSTVRVNTIEPAVTGSVTYFLAKAWINFNGTGTPAVRASGNISSITDGGTGRFTINTTNPIADINYATVASASRTSTLAAVAGESDGGITKTTSAVQVVTNTDAAAAVDPTFVSVVLVR